MSILALAIGLISLVLLYLYFSGKNDINFNLGPGKVIVLYFAPWCKFCVEFKPVWEELKGRVGDGVRFMEVDGSDHPELMKFMNVRGFPSIVMYKDGKEISRYAGKRTLESLIEFIKLA
jgi:thiol-disulfide isomerase/thioredoxin